MPMGISLSTIGVPFQQNVIAQILGGAAFALPLTHTAVPTAGSIVPTFTRATTETGQRWDEAGYLDFTALTGEMVFKGARRVRNLVPTKSEDATADAYVSNANSSATTAVVTLTTVNASFYFKASTVLVPAGAAIAGKLLLSAGSKTSVSVVLQSGSSASGAGQVNATLTSTPQWVSVSGVQGHSTASAIIIGIDNRSARGASDTSAGTVNVHAWQLEDVTGQTTQTASEYVSVGVTSAPAYHGSGVDGVLCSDLDRSGNPISTSGSYPIVGYVPWEARTNLCLQSEDIMTTWTTSGGARNANQYVAPNGTLTMDQMVGDGVSTNQAILQAITTSAGASVFSFYARYDTTRWINARLYDGTNSFIASFDILNGVAGSLAAGTTSTIERINSTMYRCQVKTATGLSSAGGQLLVAQQIADTASIAAHTNAITDKTGVWGFQYEAGSFATPYIPTTTVAVARNASLLTYTGLDSALGNQGWCCAEITSAVPVGTQADILDAYAAGAGMIPLLIDASNRLNLLDTSITARVLSAAVTRPVTTYTKCASTWGGTTSSGKFGSGAVTSAGFTAGTLNKPLAIGIRADGTQALNGGIRNVYIGYRKLSDSELGAVAS